MTMDSMVKVQRLRAALDRMMTSASVGGRVDPVAVLALVQVARASLAVLGLLDTEDEGPEAEEQAQKAIEAWALTLDVLAASLGVDNDVTDPNAPS